jgi:hypothetical protein
MSDRRIDTTKGSKSTQGLMHLFHIILSAKIERVEGFAPEFVVPRELIEIL